jgi:hypothetical protein
MRAAATVACTTVRRELSDGTLEVVITLRGDEASEMLDFVLKDDATNTWWVGQPAGAPDSSTSTCSGTCSGTSSGTSVSAACR